MTECLDAMKRPIPCQWQDVVQVPELAAITKQAEQEGRL